MRPSYLCFSIVVLAASPSSRSFAQRKEGDPQAGLAAALAHSPRIRIRFDVGPPVEVREAQLRDGILIGRAPLGEYRSYPIANLQQVWSRASGVGRGFAIGGAVGFGIGAILGVAASNICIWGDCHVSFGEQAGAAAAGGTVVGLAMGTVGALIGAATGRWRSVYEIRRNARVTPLMGKQQLGLSITF